MHGVHAWFVCLMWMHGRCEMCMYVIYVHLTFRTCFVSQCTCYLFLLEMCLGRYKGNQSTPLLACLVPPHEALPANPQ